MTCEQILYECAAQDQRACRQRGNLFTPFNRSVDRFLAEFQEWIFVTHCILLYQTEAAQRLS